MNIKTLAELMLRLAIVFAMVVVASTVVGSVRYLRPGPGFDFWGAAMPFLKAAVDGPWSWSMLWEMSAGAHRLVVPRILFWLEWWLGDFRNEWLLAFAWMALIASALLVLRRVWQDPFLDRHSRSLCCFLVLMGFGSAQHMNNLAYAFNLQWSWGLLLSLLFIDGVVQAAFSGTSGKKWLYFSSASLSVFFLTFTTFSLPVILCTWLFLAWSLRIRQIIVMSITVILLIANIVWIVSLPIYHDAQVALNSAASTNMPTLWQVFLYLGGFVLSYLGSPLSAVWLMPGMVLAVVALLFIIDSVWCQRISDSRTAGLRPLLWLALAYAVFVVVMAFVTAIGRTTDPAAAISPRFRTFILPLLVLLAIILVCRMQNWREKNRFCAAVGLIALTTVIVMPGHLFLLKQFSEEYDDYVTPTVAMAVGLAHPDVVHEARLGLWWAADNRMMLAYRPFLQEHQKGIYAEPYSLQLGKYFSLPAGSVSNPSDLASFLALPDGGYQLKGYTDVCGSDGRIALVDEDWAAIGAGLVSRALPDAGWRNLYRVFLPLCSKGKNAAWTAFLPVETRSGQLINALVFPAKRAAVIAEVVIP